MWKIRTRARLLFSFAFSRCFRRNVSERSYFECCSSIFDGEHRQSGMWGKRRYRMLATDIFGVLQRRWSSSEFSWCSQYHSFESRILRAGALKFTASYDSRDSHLRKVSRLSVLSLIVIWHTTWSSHSHGLPGETACSLHQARRVPSTNKSFCAWFSHDSSLTCHFYRGLRKKVYTCRKVKHIWNIIFDIFEKFRWPLKIKDLGSRIGWFGNFWNLW